MHLHQIINFSPIFSSSPYHFRFPCNSQNRSKSNQTLNLDSFLSSSSYPCSLSCDSWNMSNLIHPLKLNCSDMDKRFAVCASKGRKRGNHFSFRKTDLASKDSLWKLYEKWCNHYGISRDLDEKYMRFNVFKEKAKIVYEHNKKKDVSYTAGLNEFSDRTDKELFGTCRARFRHRESLKNVYDNSSTARASLDGRSNGAVSGDEDQGQHGYRFTFGEKDLTSVESLWKLYEKWCNHHEISRDFEEKLNRFNIFKKTAKFVFEHSKKNNVGFEVGLHEFADITSKELVQNCLCKSCPACSWEIEFRSQVEDQG